MKVTKTEELSKSRVKVYIDEEFAFVLYKGELRSLGIREGEELKQESHDAIMSEILPKRAKLRAMNLLTGREYTVKQLRDKLEAGGYPEQCVEEALSYVAGFRYTDDLRYAENYILNHASVRSRGRIEQELLRKGIDRETVEKAWLKWEDGGGAQDETEMIRVLMEKKNFDPGTADMKERRKMYGFLIRKGFEADRVRRAVLDGADCEI